MGKKVLIIGTSPRLHGNSNILARSFAKGAEEAGNEVEFVPMAGKRIGFCIGCWGCLKTKSCVVNSDDAEEVVQKIRRSDVVVFCNAHLLLRNERADEDPTGSDELPLYGGL